jgi:hypothetical protein
MPLSSRPLLLLLLLLLLQAAAYVELLLLVHALYCLTLLPKRQHVKRFHTGATAVHPREIPAHA